MTYRSFVPDETLRTGFAIEFRSRAGFHSFQSWSGARSGIVRSDRAPIAVAFWPTAEAAAGWLKAVGLVVGGPVPIGIGDMTAGVVETSYESIEGAPPPLGLMFEIPRELMPGMKAPKRGQAAFAFGD